MTDSARSVAADPRAPASERYDAQAELQAAHRPTQSDLLPRDGIAEMVEMARADLSMHEPMAKAGQIIQFPGEHSARGSGPGMKSIYLDKLQIFVSGEYYEKPSPIGFEALRQMVEQTPILNAVIMTRIKQISRFCQMSEDGGPGFEIRHVDRKHTLTSDEEARCRQLGRFISNCGWEFNPRKRKTLGRSSFTQFMAKSVRDSLTFDACPVETEMKRNRSMGIDGFYAVDGSTVRLCTEDGYEGDDKITALQVVQGRVATAYTNDTLIYEVRNPRTDVRLAGYGLGEPELLVRVVTGLLNAMAYNNAGFDQNAIPRGMLNLVGQYDQNDLAAFKRSWNGMVKGVNNAWAMPVMVSSDEGAKASFTKFGADYDEMMFAKWMTFLTSIICAIYGMSPDEINFESFAASKSSLSGSDTEEKLTNSKDIGLHPNMAFYEAMLTDYVITDDSDQFCLRWVGIKPEDQARIWEAKKLVLTVDELRAEQGYGKHPNPVVGALPLNPSLIGPAVQASQPAPQGGDFGGGPGAGQPDFGEAGADDEAGADPGAAADADGKPPGGNSGGGMQPPQPRGAPAGDFGGGGADGFGKAMTIYKVGA